MKLLDELKLAPHEYVQIKVVPDEPGAGWCILCYSVNRASGNDCQSVGSFDAPRDAHVAATELRGICRAARRLLGLESPWLKP